MEMKSTYKNLIEQHKDMWLWIVEELKNDSNLNVLTLKKEYIRNNSDIIPSNFLFFMRIIG